MEKAIAFYLYIDRNLIQLRNHDDRHNLNVTYLVKKTSFLPAWLLHQRRCFQFQFLPLHEKSSLLCRLPQAPQERSKMRDEKVHVYLYPKKSGPSIFCCWRYLHIACVIARMFHSLIEMLSDEPRCPDVPKDTRCSGMFGSGIPV